MSIINIDSSKCCHRVDLNLTRLPDYFNKCVRAAYSSVYTLVEKLPVPSSQSNSVSLSVSASVCL